MFVFMDVCMQAGWVKPTKKELILQIKVSFVQAGQAWLPRFLFSALPHRGKARANSQPAK